MLLWLQCWETAENNPESGKRSVEDPAERQEYSVEGVMHLT